MAEERTRRIGENEVLYRTVNEEIHALDERFGAVESPTQSFLCECGRIECAERIELTVEEYLDLRGDPATFAVVPGHEEPDVEYVVERRSRYAVIRKREGEPARLASGHDPTSP